MRNSGRNKTREGATGDRYGFNRSFQRYLCISSVRWKSLSTEASGLRLLLPGSLAYMAACSVFPLQSLFPVLGLPDLLLLLRVASDECMTTARTQRPAATLRRLFFSSSPPTTIGLITDRASSTVNHARRTAELHDTTNSWTRTTKSMLAPPIPLAPFFLPSQSLTECEKRDERQLGFFGAYTRRHFTAWPAVHHQSHCCQHIRRSASAPIHVPLRRIFFLLFLGSVFLLSLLVRFFFFFFSSHEVSG